MLLQVRRRPLAQVCVFMIIRTPHKTRPWVVNQKNLWLKKFGCPAIFYSWFLVTPAGKKCLSIKTWSSMRFQPLTFGEFIITGSLIYCHFVFDKKTLLRHFLFKTKRSVQHKHLWALGPTSDQRVDEHSKKGFSFHLPHYSTIQLQ